MDNQNRFNHIFFSIFVILLMVFSACSDSTDSGEDPDPNPPASFDSGTLSPGENYSYTFEDEGDVDYYCQFHTPDMTGVITVTSDVEAVERDTVSMDGMQFQPSQLSVAPGTEVVWVNESDLDHTVTSGTPSNNDDGDGGDY